MPEPDLKEQVRQYWNQQSCDTQAAAADKFTLEYFEEIETFRSRDQPFIHAFAQFYLPAGEAGAPAASFSFTICK